MRVIIAGSRSIGDDAAVREAINASGFPISEIVSGGSRGVDASGERIAAEDGISLRRFPANWRSYGKRAGPIRNRKMALSADALVAVWDGRSRGTWHMIETMKKAGKLVYIHIYKTAANFVNESGRPSGTICNPRRVLAVKRATVARPVMRSSESP